MTTMEGLSKNDDINASFVRMFLLGLVVISPAFLFGLNLSYTTVALPQMNFNMDDASWFASISGVTSPISTIVSGLIIDRFGRKSALLFAVVPSIGGWLLLLVAGDATTALAGQALNGLTVGAVGYSSQVYAGECIMMNDVRLRSRYIMGTSLSSAVATLVMYAMATFMTYRQICAVAFSAAVVTLLLLHATIPESPTWLYRRGRIRDAERSQRKLGIVQPILKSTDVAGIHAAAADAAATSTTTTAKHEWKPLLGRNPRDTNGCWTRCRAYAAKLRRADVRKPLVTFSTFTVLYAFAGSYCVMTYTIDVFGGNGFGSGATSPTTSIPTPFTQPSSPTDTNTSRWLAVIGDADDDRPRALANRQLYAYNLVSGALMLASAITAAFALPYLGLRRLLVLSEVGSFAGMATLAATGTASPTDANASPLAWRVIAVWWMAFLFSWSANTVFAAAGDAFPADAKGYASVVHLCGSTSATVVRKAFPYVYAAAGGHYVYGTFAVVCLVCAVYAYCCLAEVVGKTLDDINRDYLR